MKKITETIHGFGKIVFPKPKKAFGLIILFSVVIFAGCTKPSEKEAIEIPFVSSDSFPDKAIIKYSKGFNIEYKKGYKIINITNHFGDSISKIQYVLVPKGKALPAGFSKSQKIEIPVNTVIGMSSTHVALMDFAESADKFIGLGSFQYINSSVVRKNIESGKIKEVGIEGSMNNELIITLNPDLVMVVSNPSSKLSRYHTLGEAGIPLILNAEWLETTPLGRAEWVKLIAALTNKEALVNQKFKQIEDKYSELALLTKNVKFKPRIIIGMPFKGTWFVPDGDSYMTRFLTDAGCFYKWSDVKETGSLALNFEAVAPEALGADFWLNVGYVDTKEDIISKDVRYAHFKPFKTGSIYNNNKKINDIGSNDYWESGMVNPHLILADLIRIAHPELIPNHELVYYKQLK